ncbi:MAG: hypothetical protein BroJett040_10040 [Oligoflexia bacterium]|nr:MAG: hypothetical protein BroJett040_10040 [Oligoflexia bacterium]
MIQIEGGRQVGPLSTADVLRRISEGLVGGEEKIKKLPDGKWTLISREPQFYDSLLAALEESAYKAKPQFGQQDNEETVIRPKNGTVPLPQKEELSANLPAAQMPPSEDDEKTAIDVSLTITGTDELTRAAGNVPAYSLAVPGKQEKQSEIGEPKEKVGKINKKVMIVAGAVVGFLILGLLLPSQDDMTDHPRLIIPKTTTTTKFSAEEQRQRLQKAYAVYFQDSFEGYIEAQEKLVSLIEGAPQSVEPRGLLCLVYKELWPFVKQNSKDIEAIMLLNKATKSLDPVGLNGVYCEVSYLMALGKYTDARGIVDSILNDPNTPASAILYSLRGELLYIEREAKMASAYMEKASEIVPDWVKPTYLNGFYLAESAQPQQALSYLEKALKLNPKHKLAMIELGNVLYFKLGQVDPAITLLSAAVSGKGKMIRSHEAKAHFSLATIYSKQNQIKKALEHAEKAYQLNPGDMRSKDLLMQLGGSPQLRGKDTKNNELVFLGDQYSRAGDCLSAQAEYKAAFELDPNNALAATKAAKCLWQLSQAQEAILWLNKAIKADPKLAMAYYQQADYYSQRYNYQTAMATLNAAALKMPNNPEILRGFGLVEFRRNNIKDALGFLERAHKNYENDIETLILLARANGAAGEFQKAQTYAIKAVELDSTNNEAHIVYAKILMQFKGLSSGIYYIQELIKRFSYTIEFRLALAEMYREAERHAQAKEVYEQVLVADPKNKVAMIGLGESLQSLGQFDLALKSYFQAAILDPSDAEPLFKAGMVYLDSGKYKEAATQFDRALKINPLFPRGSYYMGKAHFLNGDYGNAIQSAMAERKVNPKLADSYILAAEVYFATREYTKCANEYQAAITLRSQGADLYVKLARCHRLAGNVDVAESMLSIAASQESGLAEIYKEQGAIYEQRGDLKSAAHAYNKYLSLSPNAPDKREIESRINRLEGGN